MNIIENSIQNLREKVDILKVYGPKILKNSRQPNPIVAKRGKENENTQSERVVKLVKIISTDVILIAQGKQPQKTTGYTIG